MEYSEKTIPLSPEEIAELRRKRRRTVFGIGLFFCFYYAVLYVIMFVAEASSDSVFRVAGIVFAVFPWIVGGMIVYSAARDIRRGEKKLIRGTLESKNEITSGGTSRNSGSGSTSYYFTVGGREISIPFGHYDTYHSGDELEIEMLPSGDILKIRALNRTLAQEKDSPAERKRYDAHPQNDIQYDTAPLSFEEEALLRRQRNGRIVRTLLWLVPVSGILYVFLMILMAVLMISSQPVSHPGISIYIFRAIPFAVLILAGYILYQRIVSFIRDLDGGRKKILRAAVQDKQHSNVRITSNNWRVTSSRGDFCYITANNTRYEITRDLFERIEAGERIKIHLAPESGVLLKIEKA